MRHFELFFVVFFFIGLSCFVVPNPWVHGAGVVFTYGALLMLLDKIHRLEKTLEEKDRIMGNRLVDGMKALTELTKTAFDHLKKQHTRIERTNADLRNITTKLHRYNEGQHRLVREGNQRNEAQTENAKATERAIREAGSQWPRSDRTERRHQGLPKNVQNPGNKS
jgi:hypothetical protein